MIRLLRNPFFAVLAWVLLGAVCLAQSPIVSFPPGTFDNRAATDASAAYDAASEAIFAAFTTPPDDARKTLINNFVVTLKGGTNIWSRCAVIYMFWAADSQAASINWINPGSFSITTSGTPTFANNQGYTGGGGDRVITGWNFSTNGGSIYQQDSASLFVYVRQAGTAGVAIGNDSSSFTDYIHTHWAGSTVQALVNGAQFGNLSGTTTDKFGYFLANRSGASALQLYRNLSPALGTGTTTSQARANQNLTFLNVGGNFEFDGQVSAGGACASMPDTDSDTLYNALVAYGTGVGALP